MVRDCSGSDPDCEAGIDQGPYMAVIGHSEIGLKKLTVTVRMKSQPNQSFNEQMTPGSLVAVVRKDVEGKPFRFLYTRRKLSMKTRYI